MAALTTATARTAVKNRLGISVTTWDTQIDDFVAQAVNRLAPKAQKEVASQTKALTVDNYGESIVDLSALSTPVTDVRLVEVTDGNSYWPADSIYRHGVSLRIRDLISSVTTAKIYGLNAYVITDVPDNLQLAVFWFAISEFYDYLASNKSQYNIYAQTTGARAVDNMRDESTYFEAKAENYLDEHANAYGSQ